MKINSSIILFICFCFCFCAKKEKTASFFLDEAYYQKKSNKEHYLDSLSQEVLLSNINDSLTRELLFQIAAKYEDLELDGKYNSLVQRIEDLAFRKKDTLHQAKVLWYKGDYYNNKEIFDQAFYYYTKSEKLFKLSKKDSINWARMLLCESGVLYDIGIYSESEAKTVKALSILSEKKHTRLTYEAYVQMVLNLEDLKEFAAALKYYEEIPKLLIKLEKENYDQNKLQRSWLSYFNNFASFYDKIRNYPKAEEYYQKAFGSAFIEEYPKLHAMLLNNYASNLMLNSNNYTRIDSLLKASLKLRTEIDHRQGIISSKTNIAKFYLMKKDTANALSIIRESYRLAIAEKSNYDILQTLEFLSKNDNKNKSFYTDRYVRVKDSLNEVDRKTRNKFARIAYETNEIEEQNTVLIQRNIYLGGIAVFLFFLAGTVFTVFRLRLRNRKLKYQQQEQSNIQKIQDLLLKQQMITEETRNQERERIAKDLHDAVVNKVFTTRINLEELPTENEVQKIKLIEELKKTEQQIREISHDMHVNLFHQKQNFSTVVEDLVTSQKNSFHTKFTCSLDNQIDWEVFTIQQKTQIYLILQELLQNVNKHAQATNCYVFLIKKNHKLILRVHDDGIGFNPEKIKKGLGFKSMNLRAATLNASIHLNRNEGMTTIVLEVPFD